MNIILYILLYIVNKYFNVHKKMYFILIEFIIIKMYCNFLYALLNIKCLK